LQFSFQRWFGKPISKNAAEIKKPGGTARFFIDFLSLNPFDLS
jgi:hypothetical protein